MLEDPRLTGDIGNRAASPANDTGQGTNGAAHEPHLVLTRADLVRIERVEWLNLQRIPIGGITLFDGPGGIGKTTFLAAVISGLTRGIDFFTNTPISEPHSCLIVGVEDRRALIAQRLKLYGANLKLIQFVDAARIGEQDAPLSLPAHIGALERAIVEHQITFAYIDALFSHIALDGDGRMAQQVRAALQPVGEMCERRNVALAAMRHWTKSTGSALSRALGSVEFTNFARSVHTFGPHPNDDRLVVCAHTKSNYGRLAGAVAFEIVAHDVADDNGRPWEVSIAANVGIAEGVTSDDLAMRTPADPDEKSTAVEWLRDHLADGSPHLTAEILEAAAKARAGSRTTLWRAARALGVDVSRTSTYPSVGTWTLHPNDGGAAPPNGLGRSINKIYETTGDAEPNNAPQSLTGRDPSSRSALVSTSCGATTEAGAGTTVGDTCDEADIL